MTLYKKGKLTNNNFNKMGESILQHLFTMKKDVIAIFDIGKTNKKILLFDSNLKVVFEKEDKFEEVADDDGFLGDDIDKLEKWIDRNLEDLIFSEEYNIKGVNFSTYGASLIYLDEKGKRLTPLYNYLRELPSEISNKIYSENNGMVEFSRKTASPVLGFLNSGLQIKWLQETKLEVYKKVKAVLHFPQYLSYKFTGKITSEYTSIGCHTALWDFDNQKYHPWVKTLGINLPEPIANSTVFDVDVKGHKIKVGVGIHDSSSSLVPYLFTNKQEFILVSTGTWCIAMNPFNNEPLTQYELNDDCLCFLSVKQEQVKSSRFYMGYIHEVNAEILSLHFAVENNAFKKVKLDDDIIDNLNLKYGSTKVFFKNGIPDNFIDYSVDLSQFSSYAEAYHQLMIDLTWYSIKSIENVIPKKDTSDKIFITGGFAKNDIYIKLLAGYFIDKEMYTSEVDNASALGAAIVIWSKVNKNVELNLDLGLKLWKETINLEDF